MKKNKEEKEDTLNAMVKDEGCEMLHQGVREKVKDKMKIKMMKEKGRR